MYKLGMNVEDTKHEEMTNAVLILGKKETKIDVSLNVVLDNFDCINYKSCFKIANKERIFKFPQISKSTMLSILHFLEKGKQFLVI